MITTPSAQDPNSPGFFRLRLTTQDRERLRLIARHERRSMNSMILGLIKDAYERLPEHARNA